MPHAHRLAHHLPRRAALLAAAAAVGLAGAAPTPAQAANSCRSASMAPGNQVLIVTQQAVVFYSKKLGQDVACTFRDRRQVKLQNYACCQVERYALDGRYLAYAYRLSEAHNEVDELGVVDLRTGKRQRYGDSARISTGGYAAEFYVTAKGTLAWVQTELGEDGVEGDPTVHSASRGGAIKELDSGKIDAGSLAVSPSGRTLYWTKAGTAMSSALD